MWTERMRMALEKGVQGGRWYSRIDKVTKPANLDAAFGRVKANGGSAGVDHVTVEMFEQRLEEELGKLAGPLKEGTYEPQAVKRVPIPKPGSKKTRPRGIPTVRDRGGPARGPGVDRASWADAPPGENAYRPCGFGWIRISGLPVSSP